VPIAEPAQVLQVVVMLQLLILVTHLVVARPQRGVLLLAVLTPFDGLLLLVPHPPVAAGYKEALLLITLGATFVAPASARAARRLELPGWVYPLLGFAAVSVASAAYVQGTQALVGLKLNLFYALLIPVLYRCPLSWRERDRLISILMVVGAVTAAVGVVQQVVGGEALFQLGYQYNETIRTAGGTLRSFSTFNQPFPFGFYAMLVLLIGLPVALADRTRTRNVLFLLSIPLLVVGMLSSIVRAAIVGLVVGVLFLYWHRFRLLAHLVGPGLVALLLLPQDLFGTLLSSSSLGERSTGWSQTIDRVIAAPFGNGIGSTGSAAERTAELSGSSASRYQPDNYYFKTVFELGPLGLWMLVLLLVSGFLFAAAVSRVLHAQALARVDAGEDPDQPVLAAERQDAALSAGIAAPCSRGPPPPSSPPTSRSSPSTCTSGFSWEY
jgi:hypothetical protein